MQTTRLNALRAFTLAFFALAFVSGAGAQQLSEKLQNAVGHWQVMPSDGSTGGQVQTYIENGKLFGRVTKLRPGHTPTEVCEKCSGADKNQTILGMVFLRNFHPDGDNWVDGTVVDPWSGKVYSGKVWTEGMDDLHLRGFLGISLLGRTERWVRIP
ncbi:MAG: DUF2147 domain-containing protein [Terracidiphilus sp.]